MTLLGVVEIFDITLGFERESRKKYDQVLQENSSILSRLDRYARQSMVILLNYTTMRGTIFCLLQHNAKNREDRICG